MREPLSITDEDRRTAWDAFFESEGYPPFEYDEKRWDHRHTRQQLDKVIAADRKRVAERSAE